MPSHTLKHPSFSPNAVQLAYLPSMTSSPVNSAGACGVTKHVLVCFFFSSLPFPRVPVATCRHRCSLAIARRKTAAVILHPGRSSWARGRTWGPFTRSCVPSSGKYHGHNFWCVTQLWERGALVPSAQESCTVKVSTSPLVYSAVQVS